MPEWFGEDFGAEQFFQDVLRDFRGWVPGAIVIQKAVGYERVDVRMEVEVFAETVKGQEEGGAAFREIEGGPEGGGDRLLGEGAQAFQEASIPVECGPEQLGQSEREG